MLYDDLPQLAATVRDSLKRYVAFHSKYALAEEGTVTLWIMHTHIFHPDENDFTPYLVVQAPTRAAGKSAVFDVAYELVARPMRVADPTPAALYTRINRDTPTVLIDEADQIEMNKSLRTVLNSGYQPGTPIPRAGQNAGDYEVFCPKAFAGITGEKPPITGPTLSRCIQIPMRRRIRGEEPIEKFVRTRAKKDLLPVRRALEQWALRNGEHVRDVVAHLSDLPDQLGDREADMWRELIGIADCIGPTWGHAARKWAVQLSTAAPSDPEIPLQILADCYHVLRDHPKTWIASAELADRRNTFEGRDYEVDLNPNQLGKRLKALDISPDHSPRRVGGRSAKPQRGYTFRTASGEWMPDWRDALRRYNIIGNVEPAPARKRLVKKAINP